MGSVVARQHRMPMRVAVSTSLSGPSRSISCAYTVLTELIVASSSVRLP